MMGPVRLRLVCGLSTLAVCGGAAALVAADSKPASAPLTPPAGTAQTASLVIPPSCSTVRFVKGGRGTPQLSPAAQKALAAIQAAAGDKTKIRALLGALSAKDRTAVSAAMRSAGSSGAACPTPSGTGGGTIDSSVSAGGSSAPVVVSNVS